MQKSKSIAFSNQCYTKYLWIASPIPIPNLFDLSKAIFETKEWIENVEEQYKIKSINILERSFPITYIESEWKKVNSFLVITLKFSVDIFWIFVSHTLVPHHCKQTIFFVLLRKRNKKKIATESQKSPRIESAIKFIYVKRKHTILYKLTKHSPPFLKISLHIAHTHTHTFPNSVLEVYSKQ